MKKFEIRTMTENGHFKTVKTENSEQACRIYEKFKKFAKTHGIYLEVALWCDGWLQESATINPLLSI
jgi:hypothetical protein